MLLIAPVINPVTKAVAGMETKNVSVSKPAPNFSPIKVSLKNPNNLLPRVSIIIIKADFATFLNWTYYFLLILQSKIITLF